jgi:hypoxanthine phosphoribosyltransferase
VSLESRINEIVSEQVKDRFDIVIGIKSAGAYIAKYVAQQVNCDSVLYVKTHNYSSVSYLKRLRNSWKSFKFMALEGKYLVSGVNLQHVTVDASADIDQAVRGKKVLVVDDGCVTGCSLVQTHHFLMERGAASVKTLVLISYYDTIPTYCGYDANSYPLVWPWGLNMD